MARKKVALVLSGGAALGFAHIGVLKVLEKYKVPIDIVVGTSMGGLVGATYCTGMSPKQMQEFALKFRKGDMFDINFNVKGLFSGRGVMRRINKYVPDVQIEHLNIPFACVATDLLAEKEIIFKTGSLRDAIRSTIAIPGFFVPLYKDGMVLVDGGVVNNMPDEVAMEMGADVIISVDVMNKCKPKRKPKDITEVLLWSANICAKELQKYKSVHSDIILTPDTSKFTQMGFGKENAMKCIKEGEKEALKHIDEILKLVK